MDVTSASIPAPGDRLKAWTRSRLWARHLTLAREESPAHAREPQNMNSNPRWRSIYRPVEGVRPWAPRVAWLVVLLPLPSSLWRMPSVWFGEDRGRGDVPAWLAMEVYVTLISVVSMLLAFTAVGLVACWGEVWPRRLPVLGGRQ
ncbi:hypothetical protein ACFQ07_07370, partial [Actinomadura adrarensis]